MYELFLVLLDADVVGAVVDVDVAVLRPQPHRRLLRLQVAFVRGRCSGGLKKLIAKLRELPSSQDEYCSRNLNLLFLTFFLQYSTPIRCKYKIEIIWATRLRSILRLLRRRRRQGRSASSVVVIAVTE